MKLPGPPAGPSSPPPPRNPAPLPRPASPPTPPPPSKAFTALALALAAVSISAGIAIMVAPLGHTQAWNLPTAYVADFALVPLAIVWALVSLLLPMISRPVCSAVGAAWHTPRADPTGRGLSGPVGPTCSPDRRAVSAAGTG